MNTQLNQPVQGLRGLSIFLVFLSHWYAGLNAASLYPAALDGLGVPWFNVGKYGVELFFMISGFVIIKSLRRHGQVRSFLIDRVARIYPLFLTLHVLVFVGGPLVAHKFFAGVGPAEWVYLFVVNLLLLPGIFDLPIAQIVAWSLSYEVFFYLLAAAAWLLARRPAGLARRAGQLGWLAAAAAALWFHPRMIWFIPGVLAALSGPALAAGLRRVPGLFLPFCLGLFLLAWSVVDPADGANLGTALSRAPGRWLYFLAALVAGSIFFWHVVLLPSATASALGSRWVARFGDLSYSFYLWHLFAVVGLRPVFRAWVFPVTGELAGFWLFGLAALSLATAVSVASRALLEVRAGDLTRAWLHRRCGSAPRPGSI
jgi:peptidoglycan/LPS O-acetylase OafA/YrhL